jgi:HK97 family phage portal protein
MPLFTDVLASFRRRPALTGFNYLGSIREGSIDLADGLTASYAAMYRRQPWVYASVNKLARSVARMPLKAYQRDDEARRRLFDGDLHRLMTKPGQGMIPFAFKERIVKNTAIYGNAFVVKLGAADAESIPQELFAAPSIGWSIGKGDTYVWTARDGKRYPFPRWQVIHFRFWDLDEHGFGMSMLEPLRMTLAIEDAAQRYGVSAFRNGARPGSTLKTDKELTEPALERLKAALHAIHGGVDNAFKVAVLEQGLDWAPFPHNLEEAAVVEHRKLTREEVTAVIDVPQPTVGILDEANFASVDQLHTMLYQDSLGPWVSMIEETVQAELVEPIPEFAGQFVEFDLNAVMRGDILSRYRAYAIAINASFKSPDEIRALENDPPMADKQPEAGLLRFNLNQKAGEAGARLSEDSGQEDD